MTSREVKDALLRRHYASADQMPGPWTCIEEFKQIDLLAFSAWSSEEHYARVGYEVKVSRGDMRSELLHPYKRARNVEWCNSFYFAVPSGLLTDAELDYLEPEWAPEDWHGEQCSGFYGRPCSPKRRHKTHYVRRRRPSTGRYDDWDTIVCPTCKGKGTVSPSRVEREAPQLWIPRDVGLITVSCEGHGTMLIKRAPKRKEVPPLTPSELGSLVRFVSMRPDPRHRR